MKLKQNQLALLCMWMLNGYYFIGYAYSKSALDFGLLYLRVERLLMRFLTCWTKWVLHKGTQSSDYPTNKKENKPKLESVNEPTQKAGISSLVGK